jgi:hypothetical protein
VLLLVSHRIQLSLDERELTPRFTRPAIREAGIDKSGEIPICGSADCAHAPFGPPHTVARPLRPFETRKHNFYAMFGLLLRADQGTAKRAIIFGGYDRGSRKRRRRAPPGERDGGCCRGAGGEEKVSRRKLDGEGGWGSFARLRQKYLIPARRGWKTTPRPSRPKLSTLFRIAVAGWGVCVRARTPARTHTCTCSRSGVSGDGARGKL